MSRSCARHVALPGRKRIGKLTNVSARPRWPLYGPPTDSLLTSIFRDPVGPLKLGQILYHNALLIMASLARLSALQVRFLPRPAFLGKSSTKILRASHCKINILRYSSSTIKLGVAFCFFFFYLS
jgi:hypothetical protein